VKKLEICFFVIFQLVVCQRWQPLH